MDKVFILKLAFRNLFSHPLRSLLTLAGIVIGIGAIVFLVSFAFGIERLVTGQVTGGDAFKLVDVGTGNSLVVSLNDKSVDKIRKYSFVKNTEVIINTAGKVQKDSDHSMDTGFYGTTPTYLNWLGYYIKWGKMFQESTSKKQVVVNLGLIKFLGDEDPASYIGRSYKFDIIIPKELSETSENLESKDQEYIISGIINDESQPFAYTYYKNVNEIGSKNYSQAKVEVAETAQVPAIRKQVENMGFKTQYVGDTVQQITEIFNIFKLILGGFGLIALVVAALGMFNTLTISLLERTKEVALMKVLGMKKKDVRIIFLTESMIFGFLGGAIGVLLGLILGRIGNSILNYFALQAGGNPVSVFYYPVGFIAIMMVFSLIIGLVTGLYPARRASRVNALDVIRYE